MISQVALKKIRSKQIRFETSMLQSDLCDFSDAYIVSKGTITVKADNYEHKRN